MHILNRVPNKIFLTYELWTGRKPLSHLCVWGYPIEVRICNQYEQNYSPQIVSC